MLIYTLKPNKKRAVIPRTITLFLLCVLFYLGIQLNFYLLEIEIPDYTAILIMTTILLLFALESVLNYSKIARLTYSFFDDKIAIQNKESESLFYYNIRNIAVKRNLADKLFDTAELILSPNFSIKFINNYPQLYNWVQQLVERSKKMVG